MPMNEVDRKLDLIVRRGAFSLGFLLMIAALLVVTYDAWLIVHWSLDRATAAGFLMAGSVLAAVAIKLVKWSRP
ncbi:hypothetical protein ACN8ZM_40005 (plasmid) [Burkholderia aenigmatica]|uniref:hypothetical protein n=1 Tax=Burkholderia aenigmatica TaxID=2015348 RepID=UPI003B431646